ncbi:GCN5 family acetyltransferase [Actinoplanes utahensis]|uniref:GCN5 family acetyltransferase n=1 Tax=Actinoplanes utahensis TaxID=1869 RepID=A0A0A6UF49_ACTUT|nr:GCN5 family acetyltransferase [Actinoplanes utahensis]
MTGSGGPGEQEILGIASLTRELVADGAALGWLQPPEVPEIRDLLVTITAGIPAGDAAMAVAVRFGAGGEERVAGFGYWRRHQRPTHRPHADLERLAVDPAAQGRGLGRTLLSTLIAAALRHRVEVLTLDLRGDNSAAAALYKKVGFHQYGRLENFVAVGDARYDRLLYALDLREFR